jgi:hypothetical protein
VGAGVARNTSPPARARLVRPAGGLLGLETTWSRSEGSERRAVLLDLQAVIDLQVLDALDAQPLA